MATVLFVDIDEDFEEDDFVNARSVVIEHLFKHNVLRAELKFSGEDGDGSADDVWIYFRDGTTLRVDRQSQYTKITNALCTPVYAEADFPSVENITGNVTWNIDKYNAEKSTVHFESSERVETYEEVSKEL